MMRRTIIHQLLFFVLGLFPLICLGKPYVVQEISHLEINSAITPATYDYLKYQFKKVPAGSLIVIKMNTPGGLITTTKDIITLISAQEMPVVVWITPEGASASSAGAIIAASAHFILMSSSTNMGAATPVGLGEDIKEKDGRSKIMNDLKALVRSLSYSRNRPAAPFEDMIENAKSFTDQEALKLKIIDGVVNKHSELTSLLAEKTFTMKGETFELSFSAGNLSKEYEPTAGQKILNVLANPSTAYFLFIIGVALLYFELQAPGGYIAGGIGIILLIVSAISFQVLPLDWGALALLLTGVVLLILEVYVVSYGLLGLGGAIAFIAGSLFLFHGEGGFISIDYPVMISTLLGVATAVAFIAWYMIKEKKNQNSPGHFFLPVGSTGVVLNKGDSGYQIKVRGEIWRGQSDTGLSIGDSVEIVDIDTDKLVAKIKKIDKE